MIYHAFHKQWVRQGCVSTHQIYAWHPRFDKNNLVRWVRQGLLVRLKNGLYTFPECLEEPGFAYVAAGCIYRPSYISLQAALAFYGLIPEAVATITSISTRKTASFTTNWLIMLISKSNPGRFRGMTCCTLRRSGSLKWPDRQKRLSTCYTSIPFMLMSQICSNSDLTLGCFRKR